MVWVSSQVHYEGRFLKPPPRGMFVSRLCHVSRGQASASPACAAGPSRLHGLNRGALRGFSHGFFLSEFEAFVVQVSEYVLTKYFFCGLLSPSLVVCCVVHLHLLHKIQKLNLRRLGPVSPAWSSGSRSHNFASCFFKAARSCSRVCPTSFSPPYHRAS